MSLLNIESLRMAELMRHLAPGWECHGVTQWTDVLTGDTCIRTELTARITTAQARYFREPAELIRQLEMRPPRLPTRGGVRLRHWRGGRVY